MCRHPCGANPVGFARASLTRLAPQAVKQRGQEKSDDASEQSRGRLDRPAREQVCAVDPRARELTSQVEGDGGAVLGSYRDPFGGTCVLLVVLPIDRVEPTPYQRDPSEPHVKR